MSSARRCAVWGGAVEKDVFNVDLREESKERSCGGRVPGGPAMLESGNGRKRGGDMGRCCNRGDWPVGGVSRMMLSFGDFGGGVLSPEG